MKETIQAIKVVNLVFLTMIVAAFTLTIMIHTIVFNWQPQRLVTEERWRVGGRHYERTARAWLAKMDARPREARRILAEVYGESDVERWFHRWRIFFLACAELFGYRQGREWYVAHTLLRPAGEETPLDTHEE